MIQMVMVLQMCRNIIDLVKHPNKLSAIIAGIFVLVIVLIILLILLVKKIVRKIKNN